jgi:RNA polymerase sigma factor (TIGR02999 family)
VEAPAGELTRLLHDAAGGAEAAQDRLFRYVFPHLRKLAASKMRRERDGHSLSPTALVAEAFLRLADQQPLSAANSGQFFGIFALTMRRVLVDHARGKTSAKHGGGWEHVPLDPSLCLPHKLAEDLLAIHLGLEKLERESPRQAKVVELRFFGGLSNPEIAAFLDVALSTVEADWRFARAWLRLELDGAGYENRFHSKNAGTDAV